MKMEDLAAAMREHGIRRVRLDYCDWQQPDLTRVAELELFDAPAPAPVTDDLSLPEDEETKPPGICIHPKCGEKNGWQFARDYCRTHGLAAAGVSGAR